METKGGCCLFLGPHNMRRGGSSPPPLSSPHFLIPPWHVQQTLRTVLCAPNTNKSKAAGYWQADVLLPSSCLRNRDKRATGNLMANAHMHIPEVTGVATNRWRKGHYNNRAVAAMEDTLRWIFQNNKSLMERLGGHLQLDSFPWKRQLFDAFCFLLTQNQPFRGLNPQEA